MAKFLFECSVKEVERTPGSLVLRVVPVVNYSVRRKDGNDELQFATLQPEPKIGIGKVFKYDKNVEMNISKSGLGFTLGTYIFELDENAKKSLAKVKFTSHTGLVFALTKVTSK